MRLLAVVAVAAAGLLQAGPGQAQSAYSYPWCSQYRSGAESCYFATRQQCLETLSGIGGSCIRSPYYRGPESR
jgi:hypothetical protein